MLYHVGSVKRSGGLTKPQNSRALLIRAPTKTIAKSQPIGARKTMNSTNVHVNLTFRVQNCQFSRSGPTPSEREWIGNLKYGTSGIH